MDPVTVGIGLLAVAFGAYTTWARAAKPDQFKKLEPMKKRWGEKAGLTIHFIAYTAIPILFGVVILIKGLNGGSLF